ncbi:hypothetical protein [Dysosmobacter welbionis]|uniref:hypothetical protein n=1 Tax=Dysosmobacter welbionis TaxID=2093857 RepID=UPI00307B32C8
MGLFGGMIAAGTGLWPLGPIGPAAVMMGVVGLVLWSRQYSGVRVPFLRRRVIGTGLPIIQVEPGWE